MEGAVQVAQAVVVGEEELSASELEVEELEAEIHDWQEAHSAASST